MYLGDLVLFCPRCNERISESWTYCPRCGAKLPGSKNSSGQEINGSFNDMFEDIRKQMKDALKDDLSGDIEFFDLKPEFLKKHPLFRSGGFRVKITRAGDGPPDIDIKAFGDIDEKTAEKIQKAMKKQKVNLDDRKEREEKEQEKGSKKQETRYKQISEYREPTCETKWAGDHLVVELDLPGVKSEDHIDIRKLTESIEIKAFAGNQGYFKILSIPEDAKLFKKEFRDHKLKLNIK